MPVHGERTGDVVDDRAVAAANVASSEVPALVGGTGWVIERQLTAANGVDHNVALRRT